MLNNVFESGPNWCVSTVGKPNMIYLRTGTDAKHITIDEAKVIVNTGYGVVKGYMIDVIAALKKCIGEN